MGSIRKQSIFSSLFIYAGFGIGAINVLYLFPRFFTPEQFGLTRLLMDIAMILATVCTAGIIPVAFKFFPFYKKYLKKSENELFTLLVSIAAILSTTVFLLMPIVEPWIIKKFASRSPILTEYFYLIFPLTLTLVGFNILEIFAWIGGKPVISTFLKEFLYRLLVTFLVICWALGIISHFKVFIEIYALVYLLPFVLLIIIVYKSHQFVIQFKLSKVTKKIGGVMFKFGSAYFLSMLLNILAKTNDTLIIASQSTGGLADAAVFTIATYLITLMDVPQRSMIAAATPHISQAWKDRDMMKLDRLYKKTALNLLIIALGIGGLVLINNQLIVKLLGDHYALLPTLMLLLGISKIIDLGTGLNSQILQLSKHWKIDLFSNMFFVGMSILLNYFLTRSYGILGTATGTIISIFFYNLTRFIFIKKIYKLQPFSWKNGIALLSAAILTGILSYFRISENIFVNSIFASILFISLFSFVIIRFKISEDISELFVMLKDKIKLRK
ncbi:MAG: lipopolysaccharide biosynthesis protein [bacterium]